MSFYFSPTGVTEPGQNVLCMTFVEYIDGTRLYLESDGDKDPQTLREIRIHFSEFIRHLIRNSSGQYTQLYSSDHDFLSVLLYTIIFWIQFRHVKISRKYSLFISTWLQFVLKFVWYEFPCVWNIYFIVYNCSFSITVIVGLHIKYIWEIIGKHRYENLYNGRWRKKPLMFIWCFIWISIICI